MPNLLMPRAAVHAWSEDIGTSQDAHGAAITRLIGEQRRLVKFVEENAESLGQMTGGTAIYLIGVVLRMFDLAGGRLRNVTWDDIRAAERTVQGAIDQLLPIDEHFPERARAVPRAQAHVLDEALYALFERPPEDGQPPINETEAFKIYLLMWVAIEALDRNWSPPKTFVGEAEYQFTLVAD